MMNTHPFNETDIQQYILGKSDPLTSQKIESYCKDHPEFKADLEAEIFLKEGIIAHRVAQIKATLSSIPVSMTPWYAGPTALWTGAAILVCSTALYIGIKFSDNSRDSNLRNQPTSSPTDSSISNRTIDVPANPEVQDLAVENFASTKAKVEESMPQARTNEENPAKTTKKGPSQPTTPYPQEEDLAIGREEIANMPEELTSGQNLTTDSRLTISRSNHPQYKKHYSYGDGLLTLYLEKESEPYKILELKSHSGEKLLYLEYEGKFYNMPPTEGRIANLKTLRSLDTIQQLQKLKN